ncbi:MAG: pyridoxamine 5'-phosphate oxidase family protein [Paracoccaceae bacterium]
MTEDEIAMFRQRLAAITAGFLGTENGVARMVPMSHQLRDGDSTIWFITARDTDLAEAARQGRTQATYIVAEGGKGLYAVIEGELLQDNDTGLRDALWSTVADSWFKGGKTDPQVCILGLVPSSAEVWLTPTSGLSFAFNILRAQVTGQQPDMGTQGKLTAADLMSRPITS